MQIELVTMTGADESVSPQRLADISKEFPFVEWGILIGSQSGMRFPSVDWIQRLADLRVADGNRMNLSLHICGRHLREIAAGRSNLEEFLGPCLGAFSRCQLNWHGERQGPVAEKILAAFCNFMTWEPTIIFQMDGMNNDLASGCLRRFRCAGLFDRSHGAGILPSVWPQPLDYMQSGYAGGLGPENLEAEIQKISEVVGRLPTWIDMETKIRGFDGRTFDLAKVRKCLEIARPFAIASVQ